MEALKAAKCRVIVSGASYDGAKSMVYAEIERGDIVHGVKRCSKIWEWPERKGMETRQSMWDPCSENSIEINAENPV